MTPVFLLTTGTGEDGNEWHVISIHRTWFGASTAHQEYTRPVMRSDGTSYCRDAQIEEWELLE